MARTGARSEWRQQGRNAVRMEQRGYRVREEMQLLIEDRVSVDLSLQGMNPVEYAEFRQAFIAGMLEEVREAAEAEFDRQEQAYRDRITRSIWRLHDLEAAAKKAEAGE